METTVSTSLETPKEDRRVEIAIHETRGSFSDRWMVYCHEHKIPYRLVNCLDSDILGQMAGLDALLWHWHHQDAPGQMVARQVIMAAEMLGATVFPSTATCWHFDDKVAQKYLLEAVHAPLVPSYVFYDFQTAVRWIDGTSFPKVFKLRKGAGSANVRIVRTAREARSLAKRAFSVGFPPVASYRHDAVRRFRAARKRGDIVGAVKRLPRSLAEIRRINRTIGRESGYVYFQDFIPDNMFDTRVTVIGQRAFAFTRNVRPGDFRASGSGDIVYDLQRIRPECIEIAFEVTRRVGSQSMAFDFVLAEKRDPLIVEVSYSYDPGAVYNCPGHWDDRLNWQGGHLRPEDAILVDLLDMVARRRSSGGLSRTMNRLAGSLPPLP